MLYQHPTLLAESCRFSSLPQTCEEHPFKRGFGSRLGDYSSNAIWTLGDCRESKPEETERAHWRSSLILPCRRNVGILPPEIDDRRCWPSCNLLRSYVLPTNSRREWDNGFALAHLHMLYSAPLVGCLSSCVGFFAAPRSPLQHHQCVRLGIYRLPTRQL